MNTVHSQPRFTRPLRAGKLILIVTAVISLAGVASAANSIGLHFMTGANVGNTNGNLLAPTDVAGAPGYAQSNWNSFVGAVGTNVAVIDSSGAATTVGVNWAAPDTWAYGPPGNTALNEGSPDGNLMNPYLDNNGNANTTFGTNMFSTSNHNYPIVYLTGLNAWLTAQSATAYDVVLYANGDTSNGGRTGEYWPMAASGPPTNMVLSGDLATHVFICDRTQFENTLGYLQVPPFIQTGPFGGPSGGSVAEFWNFPGNYTVMTGLTNDTVLIRSQRFNSRAPINAIQIIPVINPEPASIAPLPDLSVFAGAKVVFRGNVAGATPITYQWQKNGGNLTDGGNIFGSSTSSLTVSNVGAGDVANYDLLVTNPYGVTTSSVASVSIAAPVSGSYPEKIVTNTPYAYWRLNEVTDPSTNYTAAVDYAGAFTGYYGNQAINGFRSIAGPQPTDWPGFESDNHALQSATNNFPAWVVAPALNMNTNTATICAWINPSVGPEPSFSAILMSRNGSDTADLGFGNNNNLGYTWNNNSTTYNFVSQLVPLTNSWSFVGVIVTPTNAILFCYNTNGQLSATNTTTHTNEGFSGLTFIGCDAPNSAGTPWTRGFIGTIDEVSVFNRPLALSEIYNLYKKGLGLNAIPPSIPVQPQSLALYQGRTATFSITASGDTPLTYTWRKNGTNLSNGGNISGANTPALSVSNTSPANDAANYDIVVGNIVGAITSSVATLTVVATNPTPASYESKLQNLNPIAYWRLNETNGSPNVYDLWGGDIATNFNTTLGVSGPTPPLFAGLDSTNTAGSFDGSTSYIETYESLMDNRSQFSIIGWFNESLYQGARIGLFGQNDVAEFGFHGTNGLGDGQLGIYTIGGTALLDQTNAPLNAWNFVAGVATGTNVSLYLFTTNGAGGFQVFNNTVAGTVTNYGVSAFNFHIGGGGVLDPTGNYFSGSLDEVAVFNRALTVEELSDLYGSALTGGALPPNISSEPSSLTIYSGKTATFSVGAVGTTPVYQWYTNGVPLSDGGTLVGSSTASLTISSVAASNVGSYYVVITNVAGAVTSSVVTLAVITPIPGSYEASVIAMNPFAYWRFNETNGATTAFDYFGGNNGTYQAGCSNGVPGVDNIYFGFETNNLAVETFSNIANSYVTTPFGSISTNTFTFTAWVYPDGLQVDWAGLLVNRNSGVAGGFNYGGANQNNAQMLGYTWNNNNANTYGFISGLVIPTNEWSFVAVAISPTNAILSLYNAETAASATNTIAHTADVFGNNWQIGCDNSDNKNDGVRGYNGIIDEVALFRQTLTPAQVQSLYLAGGLPLPVDLTIQESGANIILTWPAGTLLQANNITGPWTTNNATSPYTNTPTASQQFYRVKVR